MKFGAASPLNLFKIFKTESRGASHLQSQYGERESLVGIFLLKFVLVVILSAGEFWRRFSFQLV